MELGKTLSLEMDQLSEMIGQAEETKSKPDQISMREQGIVDWKGNPVDKQRHGGTRAAWFIYFLQAALSMSFVSSVLSMVTYLHNTMHMGVARSSTTVTNFIGGTCAFALLGGFLSDSYITRFKAILIFGPIMFLGFGLLTIQAHFSSLRPPECNISGPWSECMQTQGYKALMLYIALYTVALGEGCLRANLASFGDDQFDREDPSELQPKSSFFNWLTFSISLGAAVGVILIVWVQDNKGWDYGFGLTSIVILLGVSVFACGFKCYRNQTPTGSPLTRMLQVFVAAFRNRKLLLPENIEESQQAPSKEEMVDEEVLPHTKGFKWLDKASIFHGKISNWKHCSVSQVEETKILLKMLPISFSAIIGYIPIPQLLTFTTQQGNTMNTQLGKIHISPVSLFIIPVVFQMVILVIYDRFFVPFARRITRRNTGITHLQRVGVGFATTSLAMCVAAIIERKRKSIAEEHGLLDSHARVPMSVFWLGAQFFSVGITDAFTFVGLLEFFNSEAAKGMKSMSTAIFWCVLGMGSLMGSLLVHLVNKVTSHGGERGWLGGNSLNKNYLDHYYWLLAALAFVAFLNYLFWARRYVYTQASHAL